jgi:transposase
MDRHEQAAAAAIVVGIDGSKAALDVALRPGRDAWHCANDEAGIAALLDQLRPLGPSLMVLEATGGLERLVVAALALAGLPVAVVHPRQVRDAGQGDRPAGQDRCLGRGGAGALRRGDPP